MLFGLTAFLGQGFRRFQYRTSSQARSKDGIITGFKVGQLIQQQALLLRWRCFNGAFDFKQQINHLSRPGLLILISNEDQIPQMMSITQRIEDGCILKV